MSDKKYTITQHGDHKDILENGKDIGVDGEVDRLNELEAENVTLKCSLDITAEALVARNLDYHAIRAVLGRAQESYDVYTRTDDNDDLEELWGHLSSVQAPLAVVDCYTPKGGVTAGYLPCLTAKICDSDIPVTVIVMPNEQR